MSEVQPITLFTSHFRPIRFGKGEKSEFTGHFSKVVIIGITLGKDCLKKILIVYKVWPKVSDGRQSKSTSHLSTFIKVLLDKKAVIIRYPGQKTDIRSYTYKIFRTIVSQDWTISWWVFILSKIFSDSDYKMPAKILQDSYIKKHTIRLHNSCLILSVHNADLI
jgi:hypothetical protein